MEGILSAVVIGLAAGFVFLLVVGLAVRLLNRVLGL
jgi:tetrahydromethanopterin S-methyltransferase subunit F